MGDSDSLQIPVALRNMLESGNGVLFVGAGIGWSALDAQDNPMPDGSRLAGELAEQFDIDLGSSADLAKAAQVVEIRHGREKLESFLSKRLTGFEPNEHLRWLFSLRWKAIFTTNYDFVIQQCYQLAPKPPQKPVTVSSAQRLSNLDPRFDVPIYHLHGCLYDGSESHILITAQDYAEFAERRRMLFELLKRECATSNILYVGYSNQDPNWSMILSEMRSEFAPATPPTSFRVAKTTDSLDREILAAQGIETLDATIDSFATTASAVVDLNSAAVATYDAARKQVPSGLASAFDVSPAATLRLLNSWEFVNQADFNGDPKTLEFLKGNQPNWATIAQGHSFARDIESVVMDEIIDFATAPKPGYRSHILLGAAGFGITTALMRIAFGIVQEDAATVLRLRPGATIIRGDVEFACSLGKGPVVFVVDNAADHAVSIHDAAVHLRSRRLAHLFLLGERLNEWRAVYARVKASEYGVDSLSEVEIERLLDFLNAHNALNKLEYLTPELRKAAIREKHDRQLLVAMKETTEGAAFSAIIEDEFRSLDSDRHRRIYAIVASAYSDRRLLRDTLLADILDLTVIEMYKAIDDSLDGVILFDCVNEARGLHAARCRHHAIAEIVWERCVLPGEREQILQDLVRSLNLYYHQDAKLFEALVRDDRQVDGLGSLEGKINFFEWACKKDPGSPYVRQHYARMLQRAERFELALSQIEAAIQLGPNTRVLYHTKGVILRSMALKSEGLEVARRRLAQAEESFRDAIGRDRRDTYAYQSLAELYLGWAQRTDDPSEQAAYLAKCEETISSGLLNARQRDELWIVSSKVQRWIGDKPAAIESLKKAGASPVAMYLLGRAYLNANKPWEARAVLEKVLEAEPEQYRAAMCYAECLLRSGEPCSQALAALKLAELYGLRDPEFIAMFGGLLFLTEEHSEAVKVFNRGKRGDLPIEDRRRISFRPSLQEDPDKPLRLKGTVGDVSAGYLWLQVPGMPGIFAPGTHIGGRPVRRGQDIEFDLAFNAEGAIGLNLS
ncbi:MAG: SIR2 family protein [Phycisphaerales bacterium]|nr:SIR2 family protein [Phycisphaerales bacterium]